MSKCNLTAKWIWSDLEGSKDFYNASVLAWKSFELGKFDSAWIAITADSWYRLKVNGRWVCDGPGRSWPKHFKYDLVDVSAYANAGENTIEVIARHFGVGDFHRIAQRPGLLVQFEAYFNDKIIKTVTSDSSWQVAEYAPLKQNTPKVSIQMEPAECYDARLIDKLKFGAAVEVCDTHAGPWKNLEASDVKPLAKEPFNFRNFYGANVVAKPGKSWCISGPKLIFPDLTQANRSVFCAFGIATVIEVEKETAFNIRPLYDFQAMKFYADGVKLDGGEFKLDKGRHVLFGFDDINPNLHLTDYQFNVCADGDHELVNPLDGGNANPWALIKFDELKYATDDLQGQWLLENRPDLEAKRQDFQKAVESLVSNIKTGADLAAYAGDIAFVLDHDEMFLEDHFDSFVHRVVIGEGKDCVQSPTDSIYDIPGCAVVKADAKGDVELVYDLGTQSVGYYNFEIFANEGMAVDIYQVEYINEKEEVQFSQQNRNGMRYVCTEGWNRYTSLKRRAGRYVFVTLRNQTEPAYIKSFRVIESVYPVEKKGSFESSDPSLNKIWEISERTLELCTEDAFVDCPLYEQTLWVGDARNESIFAYNIYGETRVAKNCIELAAYSLEKYPMVQCQVPSSWEMIIPVWSFLWVISVWDYYWFTGDKDFLAKMHPFIIKNMKGAEAHIDTDGLFKAEYWNFFDWTGLDQDQKKVTHNSMFMVGAIDAALKISHTIKEFEYDIWLEKMRSVLVKSISSTWDDSKNSYVDSIHEDGKMSGSIAQHNNFLSVLYDVVDESNLPAVISNIVEPPSEIIKVGAPFAILYLYETLEKIGAEELIIDLIRSSYQPMLDYGATTVWESFPEGTDSFEEGSVDNKFPTRSHCHAWSSVPVYYFGRLILGLKQVVPGGKVFEISPWVNNLDHAKGSFATINGEIKVSWTKESGRLAVDCDGPEGTAIYFVPNRSHAGIRQIIFNGAEIKKETVSIRSHASCYSNKKVKSVLTKALNGMGSPQ